MSPSSFFQVVALVDEAERPAVTAAAERLSRCLAHVTGTSSCVPVRFLESEAALGSFEMPTLFLASLLRDVGRIREPWSITVQRWREIFLSSSVQLTSAAFLCTIFRSVSERRARTPAPLLNKIERIRRLNLLATEISHDAGINVIDIDRVFAHVGGRALATDYRLAGSRAAALAADTIVGAFLAVGMDEVLEPECLERARELHAQQKDAITDVGLAVSAVTLGFETVRQGAHQQTFFRMPRRLLPGTVGGLLRDWLEGRINIREAMQIVVDVVKRRLVRITKSTY